MWQNGLWCLLSQANETRPSQLDLLRFSLGVWYINPCICPTLPRASKHLRSRCKGFLNSGSQLHSFRWWLPRILAAWSLSSSSLGSLLPTSWGNCLFLCHSLLVFMTSVANPLLSLTAGLQTLYHVYKISDPLLEQKRCQESGKKNTHRGLAP